MRKHYPSWFKPKHYIHLTPKIGKESFKTVNNYVRNTDKIKHHAFYPLLHYTIIQRRYKTVKGKKENKRATTAKPRPIHYATHLDAHIYAFYAHQNNKELGKIYEDKLKCMPKVSECITAYRKIDSGRKKKGKRINKCNIDFAKDAFDYIGKQEECIVMTFDVKNFFSSMNHNYLKKSWCDLLSKERLPDDHYNIFKSLTDFRYVEEQELIKTLGFKNKKNLKRLSKKNKITSFFKEPRDFRGFIDDNKRLIKKNSFKYSKRNPWGIKAGVLKGIPQGTPISAFLSNVYLLNFDKKIVEKVFSEEINGFYRRYSDDIIIVCPKNVANEIEKYIIKEINDCYLELNTKKTEKFLFSKNESLEVRKIYSDTKQKCNVPLTYLGFEFYGTKTLIKSQSLAKYYRKMKKLVALKAKRAGMTKKDSIRTRTISTFPKKNRIKRNSMSASKANLINKGIFKRKIYKKYSHIGKKNFISYANRAASKELMDEPAIRRQVKKHWKNLNKEINKYEYLKSEVSKQIDELLELYN